MILKNRAFIARLKNLGCDKISYEKVITFFLCKLNYTIVIKNKKALIYKNGDLKSYALYKWNAFIKHIIYELIFIEENEVFITKTI